MLPTSRACGLCTGGRPVLAALPSTLWPFPLLGPLLAPHASISSLTQESGNVHAGLGRGQDHIPGSRSDRSRGNSGFLLPGLYFLQFPTPPPPTDPTPTHPPPPPCRAFESDLTAVAPGPAQGLPLLPAVLRFKSGLVGQGRSLLFCPHQKHPDFWALSRWAPQQGHLSLRLAWLSPPPHPPMVCLFPATKHPQPRRRGQVRPLHSAVLGP